MSEDLSQWAPHLEAAIAGRRLRHFHRVVVLEETASTQDAARKLLDRGPGVIVLAGKQSFGRGRLGRPWSQVGGLGLAATFVLEGAGYPVSELSLGAGVAAAEAVEGLLTVAGSRAGIGLRWPNDVIETERGRKICGVLIERTGGLTLVGIGINVLQRVEDWPPELQGRAVSLHELGARVGRLEVAERLLVELCRTLDDDFTQVLERWQRRDVLIGAQATFEHAGQRHSGVVESIAPTHEITLRSEEGARVRLPALTTSLIGFDRYSQEA